MKIIKILTALLLSVFVGLAIGFQFTDSSVVHLGIVAGLFGASFLPLFQAGVMAVGFTYADITFADEPDNMADYKKKVFWAFANDVATAPQMNKAPTTASEASHATGTFVMGAAKFFIQLYATSVTFAPEALGERDSKGFKMKGEIFLPGSSDQIKAYARKFNNARGYLILEQENGERELIGTEGFPCYLNPNYSGSEKRGLTLAYEAEGSAPGLRYDGAIPLSTGQVDPIS